MPGNSNLHDSSRNKQDEFYTNLQLVEDELKHYRSHFQGAGGVGGLLYERRNGAIYIPCQDAFGNKDIPGGRCLIGALTEWERLWKGTKRYHDELFGVTLPAEVTEAISATTSVLKSPTVMRLENGEFYGWEGTWENTGSCEGTCTHVWNYAYALCFLFPQLERSIRETDFKYNQDENGNDEVVDIPNLLYIGDITGGADGATGIVPTIRTIDRDGTENYFDLQGHRLNSKPNKGIYIENGKKYAK